MLSFAFAPSRFVFKGDPVKHASWFVALLVVVVGAVSASAQTPVDSLKKLIDDEWAWRLRENPLFATGRSQRDF